MPVRMILVKSSAPSPLRHPLCAIPLYVFQGSRLVPVSKSALTAVCAALAAGPRAAHMDVEATLGDPLSGKDELNDTRVGRRYLLPCLWNERSNLQPAEAVNQ